MNNNSKVLALKYRPQTFDDLIGQEVVAETITNSIKALIELVIVSATTSWPIRSSKVCGLYLSANTFELLFIYL